MNKGINIVLPDYTKIEVPDSVAHYVNCLKNFHIAVECEVERHRIDQQDVFSMSANIDRHVKNYDQELTNLFYQGCREV